MTLRPLLLCLLLGAAAPLACAQAVWRCGADGRQFSDKPCEQGRTMDALDARPAADVAAAQDAANREKALAAQMVKERQQREAQAPKGAAGIRTAKEPVKPKAKVLQKSAKRRGSPRPEDDGIWRATAPSSRQTKG